MSADRQRGYLPWLESHLTFNHVNKLLKPAALEQHQYLYQAETDPSISMRWCPHAQVLLNTQSTPS